MDVSIIVVNFNTFEITCNCVSSIIENTFGVEYEIIIVDNGSTESSPVSFQHLFPTIQLISSKGNIGFAKGNNLGIEKAQGKYILLLNSDTVLNSDAVSLCKNFLDNHSKVAVVTCLLEYPDGQIQHNCQRYPSARYKLFELLRLQKVFGNKTGGRILLGSFFDYRSMVYADWVWGTFFMFRKDLLSHFLNKRLADDFFMYGEDMQWCIDFRKLGYKIAFLPDASIVHLYGKSNGPKNDMMKKNIDSIMLKYYRWPHRIVIKTINFLLTKKYEY